MGDLAYLPPPRVNAVRAVPYGRMILSGNILETDVTPEPRKERVSGRKNSNTQLAQK